METIPQERQASLRVIGLVSILFGTLMAVLFAGRISRPITEVARAAERFARGDLAVRASLPARQERAHDEVSLLIQNFNAMAASLARLERERKAMIADIAHELRTPLTILQGRLEGIEDGVVPLTLRKSISSTGR